MIRILVGPLLMLFLAIPALDWSAKAQTTESPKGNTPALQPSNPSSTPGVKCLPHDDAVSNLKQHYDEDAIGLGLSNKGQSVVELFVADTGSWTILVTNTQGVSCVAAAGQNWSDTKAIDASEKGT